MDLDIQLPKELPRIRANLVQLEEYLLNLLINAIDAMKEVKDRKERMWIRG